MGKSGTIDKFFKRKIPNQLDSPNSTAQSIASDDNLPSEVESQKFRKVENTGVDLNLLERDPGLRRQIWEYSPNEQEEIRRAYLNLKALQPILSEYPLNKNSLHHRRFQSSWYELFPWLEYSLAKDKAFCFPCFIFNKPSGCPKQTAFTVDGFDNWKKVRSGKTCSFQCHIGKDNVSSPHRIAEKACAYRVDLFYAMIDSQMQEINVRFNEDAMELLMLSSALNPQNACDSLRYLDICKLVEKFYPQDFTSDEKERLEMQLKHYEHNVVIGPYYKSLSTLSELCQWLVKTKKADIYELVFRVIVLVLTLPVSTATTERSFSAMNIVKTRLRSKMEDAFLSDALMIFIEREIAKNICIDTIIEDFENFKERRIPFS